MKKLLLTFLAAIFAGAAAPDVQIIDRKELKPNSSGIQGEEYLEKSIKISSTVSLPLRVDVTAKGNGVLTIANLALRIYDDHEDGSSYESGLLTTSFSDIDGDGSLDLVIRGKIVYTNDKGEFVKKQDVAFLYLFDKASKKFISVYHTDGVSIDVSK